MTEFIDFEMEDIYCNGELSNYMYILTIKENDKIKEYIVDCTLVLHKKINKFKIRSFLYRFRKQILKKFIKCGMGKKDMILTFKYFKESNGFIK